jgi:hypothetical protein
MGDRLFIVHDILLDSVNKIVDLLGNDVVALSETLLMFYTKERQAESFPNLSDSTYFDIYEPYPDKVKQGPPLVRRFVLNIVLPSFNPKYQEMVKYMWHPSNDNDPYDSDLKFPFRLKAGIRDSRLTDKRRCINACSSDEALMQAALDDVHWYCQALEWTLPTNMDSLLLADVTGLKGEVYEVFNPMTLTRMKGKPVAKAKAKVTGEAKRAPAPKGQRSADSHAAEISARRKRVLQAELHGDDEAVALAIKDVDVFGDHQSLLEDDDLFDDLDPELAADLMGGQNELDAMFGGAVQQPEPDADGAGAGEIDDLCDLFADIDGDATPKGSESDSDPLGGGDTPPIPKAPPPVPKHRPNAAAKSVASAEAKAKAAAASKAALMISFRKGASLTVVGTPKMIPMIVPQHPKLSVRAKACIKSVADAKAKACGVAVGMPSAIGPPGSFTPGGGVDVGLGDATPAAGAGPSVAEPDVDPAPPLPGPPPGPLFAGPSDDGAFTKDGELIGRMSKKRWGHVYCYQHGCQRHMQKLQIPTPAQFMEWLATSRDPTDPDDVDEKTLLKSEHEILLTFFGETWQAENHPKSVSVPA